MGGRGIEVGIGGGKSISDGFGLLGDLSRTKLRGAGTFLELSCFWWSSFFRMEEGVDNALDKCDGLDLVLDGGMKALAKPPFTAGDGGRLPFFGTGESTISLPQSNVTCSPPPSVIICAFLCTEEGLGSSKTSGMH